MLASSGCAKEASLDKFWEGLEKILCFGADLQFFGNFLSSSKVSSGFGSSSGLQMK